MTLLLILYSEHFQKVVVAHIKRKKYTLVFHIGWQTFKSTQLNMKKIPFPLNDSAIPRHGETEATQKNYQQKEYLSALVQQLDSEKRLAFNCLREKREAFVRETIKRRLLTCQLGLKHAILRRNRRTVSEVNPSSVTRARVFAFHFILLDN